MTQYRWVEMSNRIRCETGMLKRWSADKTNQDVKQILTEHKKKRIYKNNWGAKPVLIKARIINRSSLHFKKILKSNYFSRGLVFLQHHTSVTRTFQAGHWFSLHSTVNQDPNVLKPVFTIQTPQSYTSTDWVMSRIVFALHSQMIMQRVSYNENQSGFSPAGTPHKSSW